jgi:hypothetical protein
LGSEDEEVEVDIMIAIGGEERKEEKDNHTSQRTRAPLFTGTYPPHNILI